MAEDRALSKPEVSELSSLLPEANKLLGFETNFLANLIPRNSIEVVTRIDKTLGELRRQQRPDNKSNDIAFALGYLLGEQWRETFGWEWRHVTQDNGFNSYGIVNKDRSYVYFPMKDIYDLLTKPDDELNVLLLFNMVKGGALPKQNTKRYMALG